MFTIMEHTIGTPSYIDRDLSDHDDSFLFETLSEARRCVVIMNAARKEDGYTFYVEEV